MRAKRRKRALVWAVVIAVVVGVPAFFVLRSRAERGEVEKQARAAGCTPILEHKNQGSRHVPEGQKHEAYDSNPPTSGPHYGSTAPWGVNNDPVAPEFLVHNLEHGGVVIHHKALSDGEVEELEELVDSYPDPGNGSGVVLVPDESIDKPVAMASWTRTGSCEKVSIPVVRTFIEQRCGKGPEKIPLGC